MACWAPFSILLGAILWHVGRHFKAKKFVEKTLNFV